MHVCAVHESHAGKLGYMVGKKATSGGQSKRKKPRIKKRMPCQTKWHCGARHGKQNISMAPARIRGYEKAQPLNVVWR